MQDDPRQLKGRDIAARFRITNQNGLWLVPSQSGKGKYKVDPEAQSCTCPDYEYTQSKCKHQYAVEFTIQRETTTTTTTDAEGKTTTTTTETVKVTRKTYAQAWPAYNAAQTQEKAQFLYLLHKLCQGVGEPAQTQGRPRYPLEDMIFSMAPFMWALPHDTLLPHDSAGCLTIVLREKKAYNGRTDVSRMRQP